MDFLFGLIEVFGDGALNAIGGVIGWVVGWITQGILVLVASLPDNPFELPTVIGATEVGLSWLNWFVPVGAITTLLIGWVSATITFYMSRFIFRVLYDNLGSWFHS